MFGLFILFIPKLRYSLFLRDGKLALLSSVMAPLFGKTFCSSSLPLHVMKYSLLYFLTYLPGSIIIAIVLFTLPVVSGALLITLYITAAKPHAIITTLHGVYLHPVLIEKETVDLEYNYLTSCRKCQSQNWKLLLS